MGALRKPYSIMVGGFDPDKESRGHGPPAGLPEMGRPGYGGRALERIQHRERRGDQNHGPYSYALYSPQADSRRVSKVAQINYRPPEESIDKRI